MVRLSHLVGAHSCILLCTGQNFTQLLVRHQRPSSTLLIWLGRYRSIGSCRFWVRLIPKPLGDLERLDLEAFPPGHFIAGLMQLSMVTAAKGYGELVADFEAERSRLRKPQVMRIGRLPAANEAGL